jgi:tetratricopeptide (TPR) repeat protein
MSLNRIFAGALLLAAPLAFYGQIPGGQGGASGSGGPAGMAQCTSPDPDVSISACTAILQSDGPSAKAFTYRGVAYAQQKRYSGAIADFTRAILLEPNNDYALVSRANVYSVLREFDRAMQDYDQTIRLNPSGYAEAYYGRGAIYFGRHDFARAIADFDEAIRLQPDNVDAFNARGNALTGNNQFTRAIEDFGQALRLRPGYPFALMNRGNAWAAQGQYDRAIEDYDKTIALDPFPMAYTNRGNAYRAKGDYDRAFDDLGAAIRLLAFPGALSYRGDVYLETGQYDRALEDYSEAIRIQPTNGDSFHSRGRAEYYFAHWDAAIADFQKSLSLDRSNSYAAIWLGLAKARSGQGRVADLAQQTSQAGSDKWPAPLAELLAGHVTPEQALAAAASDDPDQDKTQRCEAEFYVGEYLLAQPESSGASKHLHEASRICSGTAVETFAVKLELDHAAAGRHQ